MGRVNEVQVMSDGHVYKKCQMQLKVRKWVGRVVRIGCMKWPDMAWIEE